MKLHQLEVGERGAGVVGEQQAAADRPGRVGRPRPERGRAAGRKHDCAGSRAPSRRRARRRSRGHPRSATGSRAGPPAPRSARAGPPAPTAGGRSACRSRRRRRARSRLALWPPSSPSASRPWRSASNWTPRLARSSTAAGASSQSTRAADSRTAPRPAVTVSAKCLAGLSSWASAAARPPCAQ